MCREGGGALCTNSFDEQPHLLGEWQRLPEPLVVLGGGGGGGICSGLVLVASCNPSQQSHPRPIAIVFRTQELHHTTTLSHKT